LAMPDKFFAITDLATIRKNSCAITHIS